MRIVGVLLAAGRGERFGGDKLLAEMGSEPISAPGAQLYAAAPEIGSDPISASSIGATACRNLVAAMRDVVAVVRPGDARLESALRAAGARVVRCANAGDGMGASVACGVRAAQDAQGWVIALGDMPWIRPETIRAVAAAIAGGASVAAPFHRGQRGHPVGFGKTCAAALAALTGDDGAKGVVAAYRDVIARIDVDDPGILRDVDIPQDLAYRGPGFVA